MDNRKGHQGVVITVGAPPSGTAGKPLDPVDSAAVPSITAMMAALMQKPLPPVEAKEGAQMTAEEFAEVWNSDELQDFLEATAIPTFQTDHLRRLDNACQYAARLVGMHPADFTEEARQVHAELEKRQDDVAEAKVFARAYIDELIIDHPDKKDAIRNATQRFLDSVPDEFSVSLSDDE